MLDHWFVLFVDCSNMAFYILWLQSEQYNVHTGVRYHYKLILMKMLLVTTGWWPCSNVIHSWQWRSGAKSLQHMIYMITIPKERQGNLYLNRPLITADYQQGNCDRLFILFCLLFILCSRLSEVLADSNKDPPLEHDSVLLHFCLFLRLLFRWKPSRH